MSGSASTIADLEEWIGEILKEVGTPGAAVVLERNGEPLLARGFGYRDVPG